MPQARKQSAKRRRRCHYCNALFEITSNRGEMRRFCNSGCRRDYHKFGSAFGPLKDSFERRIDRAAYSVRDALIAVIADIGARQLTGFEKVEKQLAKILDFALPPATALTPAGKTEAITEAGLPLAAGSPHRPDHSDPGRKKSRP